MSQYAFLLGVQLMSVAVVRCLLCIGSDIDVPLAVGTASVFFVVLVNLASGM